MRKQDFKYLAIICFAFFFGGCITDEANRYYLDEKLPAKNIDEVKVLMKEPQQPYTVIADFQSSPGFLSNNLKHMQKRAAEIGADAVIIVPAGGNYSRDEVWADNDRYSNTYCRLIGTAIKYEPK